MSHVFISYSTQNSQYAKLLADKLRQEGFDVWIDNSKLRSSDNWWESIVRALRDCAAVVVIMTPEAKASKWVQREVTLADIWQKPTFPVLLAGDNWEIFVLTQFENVKLADAGQPTQYRGRLPGAEFYDALAEYSPRKAQPGVDVVRQTATQPVVRDDGDDDDEIKSEIANPPPMDMGAVPVAPAPLVSKTVAANPPAGTVQAASEPLVSKTVAVNPPRSNRLLIGGLVGIVVALLALAALLSRPNQLEEQVKTLTIGTATMQQQIVDLAGQLTEQAQQPNAEPTAQGGGSGQILFASERDGDQEIYVVDVDGSNLRMLTNNTSTDTDPSWSPDGKQIAFASDRTDGTSQIYVMDADGSNIRQITSGESVATSPVWSPDGQRMAFAADVDSIQQILVMNADGTDILQLTNHSETGFLPRWSPDGDQIAFTALNKGACCVVLVMDADGKNIKEFLPGIGRSIFSLSWSPDGQQIVFDSQGILYLMAVDTGNLQVLSRNGLPEFPSLPSWSPDGQQIIFITDTDQLQVVNADGSNPRDITHDTGAYHAPSWRPIVLGEDLLANVGVVTSDGSAITRNSDWMPQFQTIDGVEMALVPVGCFMMGSVDGESDEQPVERQCLDRPFWIDRYEVTNEQFDRLSGTAENSANFPDPQHPREMVTWYEALAFCQQRGARLPTELEWEYAARGPDDLIYPWGNEFVEDYAVHQSNSNGETVDVGSQPDNASWVGPLDMSGNVWEWVSTIYDTDERANAFPYPYRADDGREDMERTDVVRVLRGGGWRDNNTNLRAAARFRDDSVINPTFVHIDIGFRCARDD
ncbi:MAG: SUMF1/EgtB/PvdO family nonheme iron enzyme [Anaerolineae bacterium]